MKTLFKIFFFTTITAIIILQQKTIDKLINDIYIINCRLYRLEKEHLTPLEPQQIVHFSLDDTIKIFQDLTLNENNYSSIFENQTLSFFKSLHDQYGLVLSIYCFYETKRFNLPLATSKFRNEFIANSNWLKFGFHGYNSNSDYSLENNDLSSDYNKCLKELNRITGCLENNAAGLDRIPRIHCYKCSKQNILSIASNTFGIIGCLGPDDNRLCYFMNATTSQNIRNTNYYLDKNTNLFFVSTDLRIENIDDIRKQIFEFKCPFWQNRLQMLILFTHEHLLNKEIKEKIEILCQYIALNNYNWSFPQSILHKKINNNFFDN